MTDSPDPVAAFKERVAGKNITFRLEATASETADGAPLGVDPATTMAFTFDEDGVCVPTWETDDAEGSAN